jgi:hypothetical protein
MIPLKKGQWKKVGVDLAPSANDAVAITKHTTSRILGKVHNPFDVNEEKEGEMDEGGTNFDFDEDQSREEERENDEPARGEEETLNDKFVRAKSPEVICLSSDDDSDREVNEQLLNSESRDKEARVEKCDTGVDVARKQVQNAQSLQKNDDEATYSDGGESERQAMDKEGEGKADTDKDKSIQDKISHDAAESPSQGDSPTQDVALDAAASSDNGDELAQDNQSSHDVAAASDQEDEFHHVADSLDVDMIDDVSEPIEDNLPSSHLARHSGERADRKEPQQVAFTDAQIEEMETDLLDWLECCVGSIEDSQDTMSVDDALSNDDESSMPEGSCSEGSSDNDKELDNIEYVQTITVQTSKNTPPQDSSNINSAQLGANKSLNLSQRSDGSVTPSPQGDQTITANAFSEGMMQNKDIDFTEFYSCNNCHLVFNNYEKANTHEKSCTSKCSLGPMFHEAVELCRHVKEFH